MSKEIFLALFREHNETHISQANELTEAERMIENWKMLAKRSYPNYDWENTGIIFQGKVVKRGDQKIEEDD